MIQEMQGKPSNYQQNYSAGANYVHFINNDERDVGILLEAEMDWNNIKSNLNYLNILFRKINIWSENFLAKYLDENEHINYVFIADNNFRKPKSDCKLCKKENVFASLHNQKNNYQDVYNVSTGNKSPSYNSGLDSAYQGDNKENGEENNILSLIYLWERYSDTIVGVLLILTLWVVLVSLFKFLTRT
jgi:hypothetical protein